MANSLFAVPDPGTGFFGLWSVPTNCGKAPIALADFEWPSAPILSAITTIFPTSLAGAASTIPDSGDTTGAD
jgi:hypothetical protein